MKEVFDKISVRVFAELGEKLPTYLTYHSVEHTKYVLKMAEYLAKREGVNERETCLIKISALYHDFGFIDGRENHEEKSCQIARKELANSGLSIEDIDKICGMIMATQIPQKPQNLLEKILADADLEYLSTQSFEPVSELLYNELRYFKPSLTREEWNDIQIAFLKQHEYHTDFCKKYKESLKHQHLLKLQGLDFKSILS